MVALVEGIFTYTLSPSSVYMAGIIINKKRQKEVNLYLEKKKLLEASHLKLLTTKLIFQVNYLLKLSHSNLTTLSLSLACFLQHSTFVFWSPRAPPHRLVFFGMCTTRNKIRKAEIRARRRKKEPDRLIKNSEKVSLNEFRPTTIFIQKGEKKRSN